MSTLILLKFYIKTSLSVSLFRSIRSSPPLFPRTQHQLLRCLNLHPAISAESLRNPKAWSWCPRWWWPALTSALSICPAPPSQQPLSPQPSCRSVPSWPPHHICTMHMYFLLALICKNHQIISSFRVGPQFLPNSLEAHPLVQLFTVAVLFESAYCSQSIGPLCSLFWPRIAHLDSIRLFNQHIKLINQ